MSRYIPEHLPPEAKKTIEETADYVRDRVDAGSTDRADFSEAVAMNQIMSPVDEILQNWDTLVQTKGQDDLIKLLTQRSEAIKAYVAQMTPAEMRLTLENLAKMEQCGQEFARLLTDSTNPENKEKYGWVEGALRYVMNLPATGESSKDAGKENIEQSIAEHLPGILSDDPSKQTAENLDANAAYAATLLAFASPDKRRSIIKICFEKEVSKKALKAKAVKREKTEIETQKDLLKALCERGAISPLEVDEAVKTVAGEKEKFTDEEIAVMSQHWEEKNNFLARAKELSVESYGAKNAANEMFTLSNVLRVFGYVAGSLTMALNGIFNFKKIKEDPSYFFRIPQVWLGAGEVAVAAYSDSDSTFGEMTASKETISNWDQNKAREGLLSVVSASPRGWKSLLEGAQLGGNPYFGVKALGEFAAKRCNDNGKFKDKEGTVANFRKFLEEKERQTPGQGYKSLLDQMNKVIQNENNAEVTETRFQKLAGSFVKLSILGDNAQALKSYEDNLEIAQGIETAPKTA
ncbi:MAG: hypothetical protein WC285_02840 [Candidatus Gracilibacteria bacterium]|jgi:prolyl-tRNA editing enzyme YbaK/EbsC (Cys-tRNA(Pro) deacylase)